MKFLFKVIILFLIVFNFRLPYIYNSAFLSIALCSFYYIRKDGAIPFTCFFQRYSAIILIGTAVLAFIVSLISVLHNMDLLPVRGRRVWVEFMMLWALTFALPLLVEGKESKAFEELLLIICYTFALQGVLSLIAYLYDPFAEFLLTFKDEAIKAGEAESELDNRFRFLNLSGIVLVELAAGYGAALIAFFWLQLNYDHPYVKGWRKYAVFFFIVLGTSFAGRTGFIGFLMGFGGWLFFSFNSIFMILRRNIGSLIISVLAILFIFNFLLSSSQRNAFDTELFPFAFEWYYNYQNYGRFSVGSMEATSEHYYYIYDETLMKGHGIDAFGGGTSYQHSDAGYINNLVFGGIPLLICLIIYQCLYTIPPIEISLKKNTRENRANIGFFLILFAYIFIVEIKAPAVGYMHIIEVLYLAMGSSFLMQYYLPKENMN